MLQSLWRQKGHDAQDTLSLMHILYNGVMVESKRKIGRFELENRTISILIDWKTGRKPDENPAFLFLCLYTLY